MPRPGSLVRAERVGFAAAAGNPIAGRLGRTQVWVVTWFWMQFIRSAMR